MQICLKKIVMVQVEEGVFGMLPSSGRWMLAPTVGASRPDHKKSSVVKPDFQLNCVQPQQQKYPKFTRAIKSNRCVSVKFKIK